MRFRHIFRRLMRSPMFTGVAILTLAIGIGANSAIFSVIEGILLKPLPFWQSDRLVAIDHDAPGFNLRDAQTAPFLYFIYREQNRSFQDVAMWDSNSVSVTGLAEPEQVQTLQFTDGMLPMLGVQPLLGRVFTKQDDSPGRPETIVLTYNYWKLRFGGDQSVIGRRILVNGHADEVIGVLPEDFHFLDRKPSFLTPFQFDRNKTYLGNFSYNAIARLKPGVSISQASADTARLIPIALDSFPPFPGYDKKMFDRVGLAPNIQSLKQNFIGDIGNVLWVLMGTIGIVLLIACANVANLLLVRAEGRQQELAIRAALGAGWKQIARELMIESLTLGILGGLAGLLVASGALQLLVAMAPAQLPRLNEISIDGWVLAFTFGVSVIAGLLFGAIPVIKYAGPHLATALRAGGRSMSQSKERHHARNILVVVQVALALVLLVSSGLMIRTFQTLKHVEPGVAHPEEVQTVRISIPVTQVKDPIQTMRMQQDILNKIAAIPGVTSVGLSSNIPLDPNGWHDAIFSEDHPVIDSKIPPLRLYKFISPEFLKSAGNKLIAGREFTWTDLYEKRRVAMVSENVARELWHDPQAAVGKRIRENLTSDWREVVGVINDERDEGLNKKAPGIVFWPVMMDKFSGSEDDVFIRRGVSYLIRSSRTGSNGFLNEISRAVWSVNPNLPLASVRTVKEVYDRSLARTSFTLVMLAIAGGMALLLGVIGIYGVISYSVTQRTREIGIRIALGAQKKEVTKMFLSEAIRLAAIGVACGLIASVMLTRFMSSLLFEVSPLDPLTYVTVASILVAAAMIASYLPAFRATAIDPVEALRAE